MCHIGNAYAADGAHLVIRRGGELQIVELDTTTDDAATVPTVSHAGNAYGGFPSPRLADQPQHLATIDVNINAQNNIAPLLFLKAFDDQIFHRQ